MSSAQPAGEPEVADVVGRAERRRARRVGLARAAAFGALALAIFAADVAQRSSRKYGPRPVRAARSLGADVTDPWRAAVMRALGIDDHVPHQNADMVIEALVAGAAALGQRKGPPRP